MLLRCLAREVLEKSKLYMKDKPFNPLWDYSTGKICLIKHLLKYSQRIITRSGTKFSD
jgi:hypothetical protein